MTTPPTPSTSRAEGVTYEVINGDCLLELPKLAARGVVIDAVITDPPYSEHVHGKSRRGSSLPGAEEFRACISRERELGFDAITPEEIEAASRNFATLCPKWSLAFSDVESCHLWREAMTKAGLDYVRTGAWVKLNATPQFTGDRPAAAMETITISHGKGRKVWNGGGSHGLWTYPIVINRGGNSPRNHTTEKPVDLMRELIRLFSNPGDTIIDPYAGSFTTGVACVIEGRNFIGIEQSSDYCRIGEARMKRASGEWAEIPRLNRPQIETPLFAETTP